MQSTVLLRGGVLPCVKVCHYVRCIFHGYVAYLYRNLLTRTIHVLYDTVQHAGSLPQGYTFPERVKYSYITADHKNQLHHTRNLFM